MTRLLFKTLKILKDYFKYNGLGTTIYFFRFMTLYYQQGSFLKFFPSKVKYVINFSIKLCHGHLREKIVSKKHLEA